MLGLGGACKFDAPLAAAFRKGLNDAGYVESQNVTVFRLLCHGCDLRSGMVADQV